MLDCEFLTFLPIALALVTLAACAEPPPVEEGGPAAVDVVAEAYVRLALAVGEHDADYVDAYYGPPEWRAAAPGRPLAELLAEARALLELLPEPPPGAEELVRGRHAYLRRQLESLAARVTMLQGERFDFDEESRALYDAVAPRHSEDHFQGILDELSTALAALGFDEGSVAERYEAFQAGFVIPAERLDRVFRAAVDACRERTAEHIDLPDGESFEIEYVRDRSWSAYNWYQGSFHSLIQVNTDLPVHIDRALDLACHEGYPGHHVYNVLLEKHLVKDRGWVELSVYPLFSPQSLIAEGTANLGIEMAFPGEERLAFEREVLYPLAGLDPARAALYDEMERLHARLAYAGNEAARRYLDGELDAAGAADWLVRFAGAAPERAAQRVRFFDQYRSYVINYNLGLDLVRSYVHRQAGPGASEEARWRVFAELLASPRLPSGLL